eukprot:15273125-Alexandrium_andersonii.AAC.1
MCIRDRRMPRVYQDEWCAESRSASPSGARAPCLCHACGDLFGSMAALRAHAYAKHGHRTVANQFATLDGVCV